VDVLMFVLVKVQVVQRGGGWVDERLGNLVSTL
jgi:hypothetical protein